MFCLFEVVWFVHGAKQQASRTMNGELGPFYWWLHVCWGQQSFIVLFVCCCCLLLFSSCNLEFQKVWQVTSFCCCGAGGQVLKGALALSNSVF